MLSLFTIWQSFQSVYNTSQNSFFRPQTDFQEQVNDISYGLWDKWTRMSEKDQQIRDFLSSFLISKNILVTPRNSYYGFLKKPDNYGRWGAARVYTLKDACIPCPDIDNGKCKGYQTKEEIKEEYYSLIEESVIDLIDEQRWAGCLKHKTKAPSLTKPKMLQIDGGWRVAPRTVSIVAFDFYKEPKEGTFKYTVVPGNAETGAGDYIEYDAATSTPLEWPPTVINYFVWELGTRFGLFTQNPLILQFAQQQKLTA